MMRTTDIWPGSTYTAPGGHEYFCEGISRLPAGAIVNYSILAGDGSGKRLTCSLDEFARRVLKRLPETEPSAAKEGHS